MRKRLMVKSSVVIRFVFQMLFLMFFIYGCASLETYPSYSSPEAVLIEQKGIYHKVGKGETLWRIASAYNVSIDEIIQINNIPNVAQLEVNQLVFIPGAKEVKEIYIDAKEDNDSFVWPVKGKVIGYFHQRQGRILNKGIDIQTSPGEPVRAAREGRVVFSDYLAGHGQTIILDHQDGFYTLYAQNKELHVGLGDLAIKNKEIARVGEKQSNAFLHFEIRKNSVAYNPLYYLP